jgi:hypothetical protein
MRRLKDRCFGGRGRGKEALAMVRDGCFRDTQDPGDPRRDIMGGRKQGGRFGDWGFGEGVESMGDRDRRK